MSDYAPSKFDHLYEGEPWAEIAKAAGIAPGNAEAQARRVASVAAARLAEVEANYLRDLAFLDDWIQDWVSQMHRDIPDEERGRIADDMCCDWVNSGTGASIRETRAALAQPKETEHD